MFKKNNAYVCFVIHSKPVHNGDFMNQEFPPIQCSSKADQFDYVDVTNDGLIPGKAQSEGRTTFLDNIIQEVKRLVTKHGDVPRKTPIELQCEKMNGTMAVSQKAEHSKIENFTGYAQKFITFLKNSTFSTSFFRGCCASNEDYEKDEIIINNHKKRRV